jgi:type I restriction-modification system DNA methylase subunit
MIKMPKKKKRIIVDGQEKIEDIALELLSLLQSWCDVCAGIYPDNIIRDSIRLTVIQSLYLQFVANNETSDKIISASLPEDKDLIDKYLKTLSLANHKNNQSELLGIALAAITAKNDKKKRGVHFTPRTMAASVVKKTLEPILKTITSNKKVLCLRLCDPAVGGGIFLLEVIEQLYRLVINSGFVADKIKAKKLVAFHCLYGVDRDPVSVECTKLAIRLECNAYDMPIDWLDDNIKLGDALVGLKNEDIASFKFPDGFKRKQEPIPDIIKYKITKLIDSAVENAVMIRKKRLDKYTAMVMQ